MPGKVILEAIAGPLLGQSYIFEEHDTFIFGRDNDCHARLSEHDVTASRHHFFIEVNPPEARIQDLGSRNGTRVNGVSYGGRPEFMTPEEARVLSFPTVDIKDDDQIEVGVTVFKVNVEVPAVCFECAVIIQDDKKNKCQWEKGLFVCPNCREKVEREGFSTKLGAPMQCNRCGKDASAEVTYGHIGDYTCKACQTAIETIPAELLDVIVERAHGQNEIVSNCLDNYALGEKLGEGGMGAVYRARRNNDGATVAVKMMLAKVAVDEHMRQIFKREIAVTGSLRHPNIVQLLEHCSLENVFCFVMEYLAGGSVWDLMRGGIDTLSLEEAGSIILQALDGLSYAHDQGFVHRDIKPQNILLTYQRGGVAKISDFGLAKSFETAGLSGMTISGEVAGTVFFMPREQIINYKYCKPVSDVWSMGATFYNMLTGETPRDYPPGRSPQEVVLRGEIVPIRRRDPTIPTNIAEVIDQAVAKRPEDRYQSAAEFHEALIKVL
ncbi:MAG TPA: protein kinase [Pyrinomonadaceae bacterium]